MRFAHDALGTLVRVTPTRIVALVSGWANIEMTASTRRIVPRRMSTGGECDPLRRPEELTIPLESSSRRLVP